MLQEKYSKLTLITPVAIHSTVMCDERTALWFRKLFTLPRVIERLSSSSEGLRIRKRYQTLSWTATAFWVLSLVLCVAGLFFFKKMFVPLSVAGAIAAALSVVSMSKSRYHLAALASHLIELDQTLLPPGTTLYQLGEIYARQYGSTSLVEMIWLWDQWLRDAFFLMFFITFGVLFLSFWNMVLWILAGCFLTVCLIKLSVMSRKKP